MRFLRSKMNFLILLLINVVHGLYYSAPNSGLAEKGKPQSPGLSHDPETSSFNHPTADFAGPELTDEEERILLKNLLLADENLPYMNGPISEESDILDETYFVPNQEKRSPPPISPSSSLFYVFRRGCIRRGGNCDHRPNDCCYNSSCRCNLWGSNCRCQRMGLFQKWG